MHDTDKIAHILTYRNRSDLARAIRGSRYELNESTTYGSRYNSTLTSVELYAPIDRHAILQKLADADKRTIIQAFHILYPIRDNDIEINHIEFLIDPEAPIPLNMRQTPHLNGVDFVYITEQIDKCDEKIASGDFEGAITNARNLIESICKYVLDNSDVGYDERAPITTLFKEATKKLNMHPSQHVEASFKQILSGCFSIVQGFASVRNELSDAHGKSPKKLYRADERHAMFVVGVGKSIADFMYASLTERK